MIRSERVAPRWRVYCWACRRDGQGGQGWGPRILAKHIVRAPDRLFPGGWSREEQRENCCDLHALILLKELKARQEYLASVGFP